MPQYSTEIVWTRESRKHHLGRANIRHVIETGTMTEFVSERGESGFWYVGTDTRGIELEVGAVEVPDGLLARHAHSTEEES